MANGNVYFGSQDGFVYDFAVGASTGSRPHATIDSPTDKATLPPGGNVTISGTASDDVGVTKVLISVRQDSGALWCGRCREQVAEVLRGQPGHDVQPGAKLTDWTFSVPVSNNGGNYTIDADARGRPRASTSLPVSSVDLPGRQRRRRAGHRHHRRRPRSRCCDLPQPRRFP